MNFVLLLRSKSNFLMESSQYFKWRVTLTAIIGLLGRSSAISINSVVTILIFFFFMNVGVKHFPRRSLTRFLVNSPEISLIVDGFNHWLAAFVHIFAVALRAAVVRVIFELVPREIQPIEVHVRDNN